jgi:hypothetical protein
MIYVLSKDMYAILADSIGYSLSYPVLHCIWLHISADPSQTIVTAMLFRTINQTVSPATPQTPDPW